MFRFSGFIADETIISCYLQHFFWLLLFSSLFFSLPSWDLVVVSASSWVNLFFDSSRRVINRGVMGLERETVAGSAPGWKRQVLDSFSITFYASLYSKLPFISQCQKDDKGIVCSTASQLGSTVGCFCLLVVSLLQVTLSSMSLWARFTNSLHQCKPLFSIKNYWQYLLKAQNEKCVTSLHMHLYQFQRRPSSVQHSKTSTTQWKQRIQATTQRN